MDMAIANLFKHKVHFHLVSEEPDYQEPYLFSKGRQYVSREIENVESIGVRNANDLCMKRLEPFFLHTISTIVREERHHIDNSTVKATLRGGEEYDDYDLIAHTLDNPEFTIHLFSVNSEMSIYSFPENLLNEPFCIFVDVFFYFMPDNIKELEVIHWVESERGRRRPPRRILYSSGRNVSSRALRYMLGVCSKYIVSRLHAYSRMQLLRQHEKNSGFTEELRYLSSRDFEENKNIMTQKKRL